MLQLIRFLTSTVVTVLWLLLPLQVNADDTEIYLTRGAVSSGGGGGNGASANVLFALDTSESMTDNDLQGDPEGRHRFQAMQDAMTEFLDSAGNLNIGLMRFNGEYGGGAIIHPIAPLDQVVCKFEDCNIVTFTAVSAREEDDAIELLESGRTAKNVNNLLIGYEPRRTDPERVALRYPDLRIPAGARIISAKLIVTSHRAHSGQADFRITAEDSLNSERFTSEYFSLSTRPRINAEAYWGVQEDWKRNVSYESPDISQVVQEMVNRPGWCGNNPLTLFIDAGNQGQRYIHSYVTRNGIRPRLVIEYDASNAQSAGGCATTSIEKRVNASSDDAFERNNNPQVERFQGPSDPFFLTHSDNSFSGQMGLRFTDINIPKGADISEAYLEFVTKVTGEPTPASAQIEGLSDENTPTFLNEERDISNRPSGSSTNWQEIPQSSPGGVIRTPDISQVVQSMVNQGTWKSGNAMGFRIRGNGGARQVYSYDEDTALAPKLFVKYETAGVAKPYTVRDELINITRNMGARHGTPITDTLYEAIQYFRGAEVDFGKTRGRVGRANRINEIHAVSHPDSYTGGTLSTPANCVGEGRAQWSTECRPEAITGTPVYKSPVATECQSNSIVVLSDGRPLDSFNYDHIHNLIGTTQNCSSYSGFCLNTLADWISTNEHPAPNGSSRKISVHTISYADTQGQYTQLLNDLAAAGGGQSFSALSSNELLSVFRDVGEISNVTPTTFTETGLSVSQFNRLSNQHNIYFSLFEPSEGPAWPGNLKKYNLFTKADETVEIRDAKGEPAIDLANGGFLDSARSEWTDSSITDGKEVDLGGAASEIQTYDNFSGPRKVYTYTGTNAPNNADLTQFSNTLSEDNRAITDAMLNIEGQSSDYRNQLLLWARGVDVFDENGDGSTRDARTHMGDPMHSGPIGVNYASTGGAETIIFFTTNEGYLHVIDEATGKEKFAFVPQELLKNLDTIQKGSSTGRHIYGLDGELSFHLDDVNGNGLVDSSEDAVLYFGMRRGGNNYYAMDVSDLNSPKLKWRIKGGPNGTPGFEELGQTWSKAEVAKIPTSTGGKKPVLVMGGGYDQNKDDTPGSPTLPRRPDSIGRGIFIVDALTGERLWSTSPNENGSNHDRDSDLKYSIPSNVRVIDLDGDGFSDQMYVGDTGGQIFRFDFDPDPNASLLAKGGLLADFGGNAAKEARRFYYAPDLSLINEHNRTILALGIGSGWRAHPLDDEVEDSFYMLHLPITQGPQQDYGKPTTSGTTTTYHPYATRDLLDVTNNLQPSVTDINANSGWMINLKDTGEKALSSSLTLDNNVIFTTYEPNFGTGSCGVSTGFGRAYTVSAFDGSPANDASSNSSGLGSPTQEDRYEALTSTSIASTPSIAISDGGIAAIHVGTEIIDEIKIEGSTGRSWWMEAVNEEQ